MTKQDPQSNLIRTAYRETVNGLLRLHRYVVEKQDETAEYNDLCAAMENYWSQMTPFERERTGGLSQDLYTVSDLPPKDLEPMTIVAHGELREAYEARERGDWDLVLTLLRRLDKNLPPAMLAYLRGTIWSGLDEPQVALVFHERAHLLAPENFAYLAMFICALKESDLDRALKFAKPIIEESEKYNGNVVAQAVEAFYRDVVYKPIHEVTPTIRWLIDVLKRLWFRAVTNKEPSEIQGPYLYMAVSLLAGFHRMLGELKEAYDAYSQLILMDPLNDAVLASRGALMYGSSPSAIADFEQAIKLNTQIIWPYYYLSHHLLTHGRFEDCLKMCVRGLDKVAPRRIRSALLEFLAISMAELGHSPDTVQRTFEEARRVDPENERATENLRAYLESTAKSKAKMTGWDYPSFSSIRQEYSTQPGRRSVGSGV